MTLQQIIDFLAAAEHGGLHAAARASGQTQPALSRSLKRLESELGVPLFERHAGGMRPTPYGQRFLVHARRVAAEARLARDAVTQLRGGDEGRVAYGISVAPSILLVPAVIGRFRRRYPRVALLSRNGLYHSLAPALRDGELDFLICPLPALPVDPGVAMRTLLVSDMALVARREHPRARTRRLKALVSERFVVGAPAGQPGAGIFEAFARQGLGPPQIELQTDGLIDTLAMVAGSDCLAMLPAALLRRGLVREALTRLPIDDELPRYTVALMTRRDAALTPAADELATQFEREVAYLGIRPDPPAGPDGAGGR
jgi:DNA-binding transcriptional LysR family regulator